MTCSLSFGMIVVFVVLAYIMLQLSVVLPWTRFRVEPPDQQSQLQMMFGQPEQRGAFVKSTTKSTMADYQMKTPVYLDLFRGIWMQYSEAGNHTGNIHYAEMATTYEKVAAATFGAAQMLLFIAMILSCVICCNCCDCRPGCALLLCCLFAGIAVLIGVITYGVMRGKVAGGYEDQDEYKWSAKFTYGFFFGIFLTVVLILSIPMLGCMAIMKGDPALSQPKTSIEPAGHYPVYDYGYRPPPPIHYPPQNGGHRSQYPNGSSNPSGYYDEWA